MKLFAYGVREREQVPDRQSLGDRPSSGGSTQLTEGLSLARA